MSIFPTEEEKMDGMRSEIQFLREKLTKSISIEKFRSGISDAYVAGCHDGYAEMYNSDYVGSKMQEIPIEGENAVLERIIKGYINPDEKSN